MILFFFCIFGSSPSVSTHESNFQKLSIFLRFKVWALTSISVVSEKLSASYYHRRWKKETKFLQSATFHAVLLEAFMFPWWKHLLFSRKFSIIISLTKSYTWWKDWTTNAVWISNTQKISLGENELVKTFCEEI